MKIEEKFPNKSEQGTFELQETKKVGNTTQTLTRNVRWTNMSRNSKLAIGSYVMGFVAMGLTRTYNEGKISLLNYRGDKIRYIGGTQIDSEWMAVKKGCSYKKWDIFIESIFWPGIIYSSIMPSVVMYFNKK